ncbi:hypothetical protein A0U92_13620 [Acetobacter aceti]|uniref:DUF2628 domain-containing protein n=1 Tax=Acetobacter aceti TaxID=435 RepID=A0A1U9KIM0_ACEAC|nr:hypothetical protein [Acetobacter aceti]AQS85640.1 hypothetical protein A0U92_13620 [Acetobacter aceti]
MKAFSVWLPEEDISAKRKKDQLPVLVPQTFRWSALLFGGVALIWSGAWISGSLFLAASIIAATLLAKLWIAPALMLAARFALAAFSAEVMEWELRLKGYGADGLVVGPNRETALLRYMDRAVDRVGSPAGSDERIPDPFAVAFTRRV